MFKNYLKAVANTVKSLKKEFKKAYVANIDEKYFKVHNKNSK